MPMYDARCPACGAIVEVFRRMADCMDMPVCECGEPMVRVFTAPMITPDIQPYKAVAVDSRTGDLPVIGSRRAHNEFLKRNDYCVAETSTKPRSIRGDFDLKKDLIEATKKVLGK